MQKDQCWNCFFTIQIGHMFFKKLFASYSEVLCCVQIYLCRMSILLNWGNQMPFTNKYQGTSANLLPFKWWQLLHNNWSQFIFLQIKTERSTPYHLVKYHNFSIMYDISVNNILGFLLPLFYLLLLSSLFKHDFIL